MLSLSVCISFSFYWKTLLRDKKRFSGKDVIERVRVHIVMDFADIAHAYVRLKAEITIVYAMLTRGPVCKKKKG